jgi:general secretion pathway protein C
VLEFWLKTLQVMLGLGALTLVGTTVVSFASSSPSAEAPPSIDAGSPRPNEASLPRYRVIADRNLFKLKEKPVEAPPEPVVTESKLQVQLLGTVVAQARAAGEPDKSSLAIVRDTDSQVLTLAVGDLFADKRAKLVKVEPRRILLEQSGRIEAVLLDEEAVAKPSAASLGRGLPAGAGNQAALQDIARNMAQASGPDAAMLGVLRQLSSQMVASIERDPSGRLAGFRIQRINEGSAFQGVGLQPGDSIKGINGQALSSGGAVVQLLSLTGGADARLTVEGANGQSRELVLPGAVLQRAMSLR